MHGDLVDLGTAVLWLATRRTSVHGKACREYHVATADGSLMLTARAFFWRRTLDVRAGDGSPFMTICRRRAFALTGRADVLEQPSARPLGTVSRNGTFRNAAGRVCGRFRDARSFGERSSESLFHGVLGTIFQSDGGSVVSGSDKFVLEQGDEQRGTLAYTLLPFPYPAPAVMPGRPARVLPRWAPRLFRNAWHSLNAPRGWRLERVTAGEEPRLELAAAIFAAELSRW